MIIQPPPPSYDPVPGAVLAWRVHAALESWTSNVDRKAGVLLTYQGGAFMAGLTAAPGRWSPSVTVTLGGLLVAMVTASAVVLPVLGPARRLTRERDRNLIYFGHLRLWDPSALAHRLAAVGSGDELAMLSRQLIALSRLSWRKHRLVQVSACCTTIAMCSGTAFLLELLGR